MLRFPRDRDRFLSLADRAARGDENARADLAASLTVYRSGEKPWAAQFRRDAALRRMLSSAVVRLVDGARGVRLGSCYGDTIVHQSVRPGALPWQSTRLDPTGEPTGHGEHATMVAAVLESFFSDRAAVVEVFRV